MMLAETAMTHASDISLQRLDQENSVDAKSIMQLMMLAAVCGTKLKIEANGSDAEASVQSIKELIENSFNEDTLEI